MSGYANRLVAAARQVSCCTWSSGACPLKQVVVGHPDEPQAGAAGTAGQDCAAMRATAAGVLSTALCWEQYWPSLHNITTQASSASQFGCEHCDPSLCSYTSQTCRCTRSYILRETAWLIVCRGRGCGACTAVWNQSAPLPVQYQNGRGRPHHCPTDLREWCKSAGQADLPMLGTSDK